jgi:hypothetical protein
MHMRTFLIITIGTIVVLVAAVWLFLHFNPLCGEDVISEETSPDGQYVAVLFERNCGATMPYVGHINLRLATTKFNTEFFNGTITSGEVFSVARRHEGRVRFGWSGPRHFEIESPESEQNYHHQSDWRDVRIEYPYQIRVK